MLASGAGVKRISPHFFGPARIVLIVLLSLLLPQTGKAQTASAAPHGKVELIAEENAVVPGRSLWVGLRFELEKDWHIYWVNPGDSGQPPRVQWTLPAGFRAGEIEWPSPKRLGTASVVDYGHEDEVLLMAPIEPPANLNPGGAATLGADVQWLVCREICLPERAHLSLSLPIEKQLPQGDPAWHGLFQKTRGLLPKPLPAGWSASAIAEKDDFVLTVFTGAPEKAATFFPLEPGQIENAAPQKVISFEKGVRLTLKKSDQLLKPPAALRGVLVWPDGSSFRIAAPVAKEKGAVAQ
jgi:DsbC/DsbD-like thiol-disulfide interchange protein